MQTRAYKNSDSVKTLGDSTKGTENREESLLQ